MSAVYSDDGPATFPEQHPRHVARKGVLDDLQVEGFRDLTHDGGAAEEANTYCYQSYISALDPFRVLSDVHDVVIPGIRDPYTESETLASGEIGPLVWSLVTTVNQTPTIHHSDDYSQIDWGPLWAGFQETTSSYDVYGVTDLSAVDAGAIAAVVPRGTTIALREVRWSLDELDNFATVLAAGAPDNGVCAIGHRFQDHLWIQATAGLDLGDVPADAIEVETVDSCGTYEPANTTTP